MVASMLPHNPGMQPTASGRGWYRREPVRRIAEGRLRRRADRGECSRERGNLVVAEHGFLDRALWCCGRDCELQHEAPCLHSGGWFQRWWRLDVRANRAGQSSKRSSHL